MLFFLYFVLPQAAMATDQSEELSKALASHIKYSVEQLQSIDSAEPLIASRDRCLATIYHGTGAVPLWVTESGPNPRGIIVFDLLRDAGNEGLVPADYQTEEISKLWNSLDVSDLAQLDALLTYNLLRYAHDVSYGQLGSYALNPNILADTGRQDFDPLSTAQMILAAPNFSEYLTSLPPAHQHYASLREALKTYRKLAADGGWKSIPAGPVFHPGEIDPRVPAIRTRLQITGDLEKITDSGTVYDTALKKGVIHFQRRYGLEPDGVIGPQSIAAMNIPAKHLVNQIIVNMTRWRWQAHDLGEKYVLVNIAGYNLKAVEAIIAAVRAAFPAGEVKILVGGYAFKSTEGLWKTVGADGFAQDASGAIRLADSLVDVAGDRA